MADALLWAFEHGVALGLIAFALAVPVALFGVVYLWLLQGARVIAAVWVWRRFLHWWRTGRTDSGGAAPSPIPPSGGAGGHSAEYVAFMGSSTWERQRGRVLRRDRGRCADCGGRAREVHHTFYASPVAATPDWALLSLCPGCHRRAHGR
jgi:hypothetical protein